MFFIFIPDTLFPNAPPKYKTVNARNRKVIGIQCTQVICTQHLYLHKNTNLQRRKQSIPNYSSFWTDDLVVIQLSAE